MHDVVKCSVTVNASYQAVTLGVTKNAENNYEIEALLNNAKIVSGKINIEELKKLCPNTPIWVGGPEVSYEIETLLAENPGIDGVFIGEGVMHILRQWRNMRRWQIIAEQQDLRL